MASIDWQGAISEYLKLDNAAMARVGPLLATIGDSVQRNMEAWLARTVDVRSYDEWYSGNGKGCLYLRNDPIRSVSSVALDGTALTIATSDPTGKDVFVHPNGAALCRMSGLVWDTGTMNARVVYTAGLTENGEAPPAVVMAGVLWASHIFKDRDRIGMTSVAVGTQTTAFDHKMPPAVRELLRPFRRVVLPTL